MIYVSQPSNNIVLLFHKPCSTVNFYTDPFDDFEASEKDFGSSEISLIYQRFAINILVIQNKEIIILLFISTLSI